MQDELDVKSDAPLDDTDLSDDDLAAVLGLMTTLTERSMTPPEQPTNMQEPSGEGQKTPEEEPMEEPKEEAKEEPEEGNKLDRLMSDVEAIKEALGIEKE